MMDLGKKYQDKFFAILRPLWPLLRPFFWFFVLAYSILAVSYFGIFPRYLEEIFLQLLALVILVLGLPLSAGFRVDQMSLTLGAMMPRELILVVASLITWLNLILISFFRMWLRKLKEKKEV